MHTHKKTSKRNNFILARIERLSFFFFTAKDSELAASGCNVNEAHKN